MAVIYDRQYRPISEAEYAGQRPVSTRMLHDLACGINNAKKYAAAPVLLSCMWPGPLAYEMTESRVYPLGAHSIPIGYDRYQCRLQIETDGDVSSVRLAATYFPRRPDEALNDMPADITTETPLITSIEWDLTSGPGYGTGGGYTTLAGEFDTVPVLSLEPENWLYMQCYDDDAAGSPSTIYLRSIYVGLTISEL